MWGGGQCFAPKPCLQHGFQPALAHQCVATRFQAACVGRQDLHESTPFVDRQGHDLASKLPWCKLSQLSLHQCKAQL